MKAQMIGEDFIIGFIFFFLLATTVFLFINSGGGSGIDFFNTSIYQEERFEMDYIYIKEYDPSTGNFTPIIEKKESFDPDAITAPLANQQINISFTVRRTGLPAGDYDEGIIRMPLRYEFFWENYTLNQGIFNSSNSYDIVQTFRYDEIKINETAIENATIYPNCNSYIGVRVELLSDQFIETMLSNNEHIIPINYCFFEKVDLENKSKSLDGNNFTMTVKNNFHNISFMLNAELFNMSGDNTFNVDADFKIQARNCTGICIDTNLNDFCNNKCENECEDQLFQEDCQETYETCSQDCSHLLSSCLAACNCPTNYEDCKNKCEDTYLWTAFPDSELANQCILDECDSGEYLFCPDNCACPEHDSCMQACSNNFASCSTADYTACYNACITPCLSQTQCDEDTPCPLEWIIPSNFLVNENSEIEILLNISSFKSNEIFFQKCTNFTKFKVTINAINAIEYDLNNNVFEQVVGCP